MISSSPARSASFRNSRRSPCESVLRLFGFASLTSAMLSLPIGGKPIAKGQKTKSFLISEGALISARSGKARSGKGGKHGRQQRGAGGAREGDGGGQSARPVAKRRQPAAPAPAGAAEPAGGGTGAGRTGPSMALVRDAAAARAQREGDARELHGAAQSHLEESRPHP